MSSYFPPTFLSITFPPLHLPPPRVPSAYFPLPLSSPFTSFFLLFGSLLISLRTSFPLLFFSSFSLSPGVTLFFPYHMVSLFSKFKRIGSFKSKEPPRLQVKMELKCGWSSGILRRWDCGCRALRVCALLPSVTLSVRKCFNASLALNGSGERALAGKQSCTMRVCS